MFKQLLNEPDQEKKFQVQMEVAEEIEDPFQRAVAKANICTIYGKAEESLEYLQEAVKAEPDSPVIVMAIFKYALRAKKWDLAEEYLQKITKADPDGSESRVAAARLAIAKDKNYEKAIERLNEALRKAPELKEGRVLLGECYLRRGAKDDIERAEEAFRIVVENDPGYVPAVIGMAKVVQRKGKPEEHMEWIGKAYRLSPTHPYVQERLLLIKEMQAKPEELPALIKQREARLQRAPGDAENHFRLAILYERNGQPDKAEQVYRFIYDNTRDESKLVAARQLGWFYLRANRNSDIDRLYDNLQANTTNRAAALRDYGTLLERYDPDTAGGVYRQAVEEAPDDYLGHLAIGRFQFANRQWDEAISSYKEVLKLRRNEDTTTLDKELINILIQSGRERYWDEAAGRIERLLRADSTDIHALTLKGILAVRRKQMGRAEEILTSAIQISRDFVPAYIGRAELYMATGKPNSARMDLRKAMGLSDSPQIAMQLVAVCERMGELREAISVCDDILAQNANFAPAVKSRIRLETWQRNWRRAESLLEDAKKSFPDDASYPLLELQMWLVRRNNARAAAAGEAALALAPKVPTVLGKYLDVLLQDKQYQKILSVSQSYVGQKDFGRWLDAIRARAMVALDRPDEAEELFRQAVKDAPALNLEFIVEQIKNAYGPKDGASKLSGFMDLRPNDWQLYFLLSSVYVHARDYAESLRVLRKAYDLAETDQRRALCRLRMGEVYNELGRFAEAEEAYMDCLKILPYSIGALNNVAYLYVEGFNRPKEALDYAEKAIRLAPNEANVLDTYGWVLAKLGRYGEAEEQLRRALRQRNIVASYYHLGWTLEQAGRLDAALVE
ncbi:MAG: tetratricopeptide repeat protein, partial [Phycisphaerae bacterium]|nr:tetratricopeptide repeat protein [Phycisphaerae bacterium]